MNRLVPQIFLLLAAAEMASAIAPPTNVVALTGDQSVILHWDQETTGNLLGYRVYRSTTGSGGPYSLQTPSLLAAAGFCDVSAKVIDGVTNFYYATAVDTSSNESVPSATVAALPHAFANDDAFLDYLQQASFDYFWYSANPLNGLIPDRSAVNSTCSIASVGFGLTAIGIAVDHGWITRSQAVSRVLTTLNTFWQGPQGPGVTGVIGYQGWFYHFLDMNTGLRSGSELSSIDTTLLLAGILYTKEYFDGTNASEASIRSLADEIFNRVNWTFMSQGSNSVTMGWEPGGAGFSGFSTWIGYNEGMIIYLLGMGTTNNPLPASSWSHWTSGYMWETNYGQAYVSFPPLFTYEYSHCWVDFRHYADAYMMAKDSTYFQNSRRAALAQVAYCSTAPHTGYSSTIWGLTACDGPPPNAYEARGLPPGPDDGTIAPTAAGGAIAFAPDYCVPTLEAFYTRFRTHLWSLYGYHDSFNLGLGYYDTDELGIDEGPIVIMIENYRTQGVWKRFMETPEIQRGLQAAGFGLLPTVPLTIETLPGGDFNLSWNATAGQNFQVEYSTNLINWVTSPGFVQATNTGTFNWIDAGLPDTTTPPTNAPHRFYRVYRIGPP